jgi:hypothetical protein
MRRSASTRSEELVVPLNGVSGPDHDQMRITVRFAPGHALLRIIIDTAHSAVLNGSRQPRTEEPVMKNEHSSMSAALENVLTAAFLTSLAFRLRDEKALIEGLRALTNAVERYRDGLDAEDDADEEGGHEALATE